jgi:hypothetical protein
MGRLERWERLAALVLAGQRDCLGFFELVADSGGKKDEKTSSSEQAG